MAYIDRFNPDRDPATELFSNADNMLDQLEAATEEHTRSLMYVTHGGARLTAFPEYAMEG